MHHSPTWEADSFSYLCKKFPVYLFKPGLKSSLLQDTAERMLIVSTDVSAQRIVQTVRGFFTLEDGTKTYKTLTNAAQLFFTRLVKIAL
jgi:hypothetical protein